MKVKIAELRGDSIRINPTPLNINGRVEVPIIVDSTLTVIDGWRRVEAAKAAGLTEIEATIK